MVQAAAATESGAGARSVAALVLGVGMSLFHLYSSGIGLLQTPVQRSIHLAFALALVYVLYPSSKKSWALPLDAVLAALSVAGTGYIALYHVDIAFRGGRPLPREIWLGLMTIVLVLEAGRRVLGRVLPSLAIIFLLYCYFGRFAPFLFRHRGYSLTRVVQHMYLTHEGIFGVALGVSSTYIFMFILFGAFLSRGGGIRLFNNVAVSLTGRMAGGPAKVAVVASALMGTINGSSVANVATTGAVTIPLMKRSGFKPEVAGAVAACASTGGQLMPPIMGAGAFIMSEFLGLPYATIAAAALIPSLVYFMSIFLSVHFISLKSKIGGMDQGRKLSDILLEDGHLFLPLILIIGMLIKHFTPLRSSFVGIIAMVLVCALRRGTRMGPKSFALALADGAKGGVITATACAVVGFLVGAFSLTALGPTLSINILELTGGRLLPTLMTSMLACLVLGMGLPTTANYIVTSTVIGPALVKLGVPPLAAHLFIFYFGIMADITPPVCMASITAAGIASASSYKTGLWGFFLAIPAFIVPYLFIYTPQIIMSGSGPVQIILYSSAVALAVYCLCSSFHGWLLRPLGAFDRALLLLASAGLFWPGSLTTMAGLVLAALVAAKSFFGRRAEGKTP
jgi:TRAP transporter 4TM/12TM fusion protein